MRSRAIRPAIARKGLLYTLALLLGGTIAACGGGVDEGAKSDLVTAGFDTASAEELSKLNLSDEEVENLKQARQGGLDGTAATKVVKELREDDLQFDLGMEMQVLSGAGFSATALVELVRLGAVRHWESDLRVMKHAGIGESTILMIARHRFGDNKEKNNVLSGNEYADLKTAGMSDVGIESFVKKGGTPQQLQSVQQSIRMGESEQAALEKAGL